MIITIGRGSGVGKSKNVYPRNVQKCIEFIRSVFQIGDEIRFKN